MGAAIISDALVDDVRATMRTLTIGKSPRIHWRDEQAPRKHLIAKTVAATNVDSLVVVGTMVNPRKQERARAQVLKELLVLLDGRDVAQTVIESRRDDDRRDLELVGHMRNAGHLSRRLIVMHGQPIQEPMLWIPTLCSARWATISAELGRSMSTSSTA